MLRSHARTSGFVLSLALLLLPLGAMARQGAAPFSENGAGASLGSVQRYFVPARDGVALAAVADERSRTEGTPFQFADAVPVSITPRTNGTWETLSDGARLWRLFIDAPGATDLNLGFGRFDLPPGATLHVIAPGRDYYEGPYTGEDATDGQLWLPVTPGSQAVVELYVPPRVKFEPDLELVQVGYGFRDWFHLASPLRQGTCNNDVICPVGDPWRDDIHSEAVFQRNGQWTCSGQMVNNTAGDLAPYFETANHCGVNAGNAATMVVYWNFESPHCGDLCCGSLAQNQTGAVWKASYSPSDFTLVRLNANPNPAWNVYYAGWDNSGAAVSSVVGIHHPNCDEKAISFSNGGLTVTSYGGNSSPGDGTHWKVAWADGVTEPGSSGSGIWDPNHRLVGQLHGGGSACSSPTLPDWYGRVSVSWNGGGTSSSRLKDWLDPLNTGVQTLDGSYAGPPPTSIRFVTFNGLDHCPGGVGDANGVWEPGEQVQIPVDLTAANGAFTNVTGTLTSTTPGVTILDGSATWPNIPAGGTRTCDAPYFTIEIAQGVACGTVLSFHLSVTATEGGPYTSDFTHAVGSTPVPPGLPVAIPDNDPNGVTSTLFVASSLVLTDVNVRVQITHPFVGDIKIQLRSPQGTLIPLLDRPGVPATTNGCASDNMDITFDDSSSFDPESYCPASNPWYAGTAMSFYALTPFNGQNAAGTWSLIVSDNKAGDVGSLVNWQLITTPLALDCNVCTGATAAPVIAAVPQSFGLAPVRPNPFGSSADISFSLEHAGRAKVEVIDVMGRRVRTLVDSEVPAGRNVVSWDGRDGAGHAVAAGVYFVRLSSGGRVDMQRVSRLR
ncbi:MAG: proprotein convertase P-domain-containing protein [bacterium]